MDRFILLERTGNGYLLREAEDRPDAGKLVPDDAVIHIVFEITDIQAATGTSYITLEDFTIDKWTAVVSRVGVSGFAPYGTVDSFSLVHDNAVDSPWILVVNHTNINIAYPMGNTFEVEMIFSIKNLQGTDLQTFNRSL